MIAHTVLGGNHAQCVCQGRAGLSVCAECLDHGGRHFAYCSNHPNNVARRELAQLAADSAA